MACDIPMLFVVFFAVLFLLFNYMCNHKLLIPCALLGERVGVRVGESKLTNVCVGIENLSQTQTFLVSISSLNDWLLFLSISRFSPSVSFSF